MKLCVNCQKFSLAENIINLDYGHCGHQWPISPVTGKPLSTQELPYCSTERKPSGSCGLEAKNYIEMESNNV